ncbi:unnamed protein product [Lathyrus sativus]|nr:unnamed protein product [Lathyrus sativus]
MLPPPYHLMSLDLNQDQNHNHLSSSSSSFSSPSSSYPNPPDQVREEPSYYFEAKHDHEEVEKIIPSSGSWNSSTPENHGSGRSKHKLTIRWKKEETSTDETHDDREDGTSMKWMSSKMRIMKKMMVSDPQTGDIKPIKFEDQQQGTDNSSSNNSNNNYSTHLSYNNSPTIRVCSDCNTTKTPLWRSGPRGPKSLCNACGIRQRKARRAMALAAASENGTTIADHETSSAKRKKLQKKKENKSKIEFERSPHMKKKRKVEASKPSQISRNKFITFEDLRLSLSQNLSVQQVFPQDEKEAAILLMALSYGLVHG